MVALGTLGDTPPNDLQPPLHDGIHLRWTFGPSRGFPWFGYYLFRRPSARETRQRCLQQSLKGIEPGPVPSNQLSTNIGELVSDRPLVFTEDFPPPGFAEVDLDNRQYVALRLPAGQPAWRAEVTVGFRREGEGGAKHCVDFRDDPQGTVENPLIRDDVSFAAFDHTGALKPFGRIDAIGAARGWDTGFGAEIKLPCPARRVYVTLSHSALPAKAEAIDSAGQSVASAGMSGNGPETLELIADKIEVIKIDAPQDETVLHQICWVCQDDQRPERQEISVRADLQGVTVASTTVSGGPGEVVQATLTADAFDEVVVGSGDAALINLCISGVREGLTGDWAPLDEFEYSLCLPVSQGDYPCPGAPNSFADAESRALDRVRYGPPGDWAGTPFQELHGRMERLVVGGPPPAGEAMDQRFDLVAGSPAPPPGTGGAITQKAQRPLDLLLLGSLQPPIAEMLGLAWLDRSAVPGEQYDYLLLADHDGSLGGKASTALNWLQTVNDFGVIDGCVVFGKVLAPAPPLSAPVDLEAYSLPGATAAPPGGPIDASNNAGLVWERQEVSNVLAPGAPVMYHVWRADLGNVAVPPAPSPTDFDVLTKGSPLPVSRAKLSPPAVPVRPGDWPPFALYYIDRARPDGWYAYQVNGIDIFGRHSPNSVSCVWRQWAPVPTTRPWYYVDPPGNQVIHASAIRLLDKIAPPPPPGVEAWALNPDDPTVLKDATWQTWWDSLSASEKESVVGLRVRWLWSAEQQAQAPDVREFRVYYNAAPLNTLRGRVTSVSAASATETDVVTDITNSQPAGSYTGLSIRVGSDSFRIVGSDAGSPLSLRVKNIGPTDHIPPPDRSRCAINLVPGHALYEDFADAPAWQDRLLTVGFAEHVTVEGGGLRRYEVLLPVAGSPNRAGLPLVTTLDEPVALGAVSVTAVDDKQHTPDHRGDPQRFGNESRVGGPATVLRIRRVRPDPPPVPPDSARLYASPADYNNASYFTYRWQPGNRLKTLVFRALDDAVFRRDFALRPRPVLQASDLQFFPPEAVDPAWTLLKRQQVAAELNALNSLAGGSINDALKTYRGLSNDGLRVLAALPGSGTVFMQVTPQGLDPEEPDAAAPGGLRWRRVGPDVAANSLGVGERAWVDTLDGRATSRWFYRSAYVDEVYNVGPLGLSSPPVWLPNVTPPRAPQLIRIRGGDRQITLEWASNREEDLVEYRVYRSDDPKRARDLRLMTLVHTMAVPAGDPEGRPPSVSWSDQPVPGLVTFEYRVVAVDDAGNVSDPSPAQQGRAHDQALPEPPVPTLGWVPVGGNTRAQIEWTSDHEVLVQRKTGGSWIDLTSWRAPGNVVIRDPFSEPANSYTYRLWARKYTGAVVRGGPVELEAQ
jgi:hypothetical protein